MEKKIRREIKYSSDEWDKVIELSAKSGKLPAAYIRDQALKATPHNAANKFSQIKLNA